jgi:hypothetical protein
MRPFTMQHHWTRLAVAFWTILVSAVCIKPLFAPTSGTVYITYATAGQEFEAGRRLYNVYHPDTDNFRYPPLVAAAFAPLGHLPPGIGGAVWRLAGIAIFLTGLASWARRLQPDISLPLFLLFALPLSIGSLSNGQANTHVAGLMLWGSVLASRGRWALAAMLVAGAALFKGYPIALAGLLVLLAPLRFGLPLLLGLAAGFLLPYAFQSADYVSAQYRFLFDNLQADDRTSRPLFAGYQDFHMLLRVVGVYVPRGEYQMVEAAAGLFAAGLVLWLRRRMPLPQIALCAFTLGSCWMCLFSPAVEASTFILLTPVVAMEALSESRPAWARRTARAGVLLLFAAVALFAFPHWVHRPIIALGVLPLGAALVTVGAVARLLTAPPIKPAIRPAAWEPTLRRAA